jgi:hypothetical protein
LIAPLTDENNDTWNSLVDILHEKITTEEQQTGARPCYPVYNLYFLVSKVTLDIICVSAFGYETDSLHNPHNELAEAYEELIRLQTGEFL